MPTYRLHDTAGDDLGLLEHPAPNLEPGDVVVLADEREALVTASVAVQVGELAGLLEVALTPTEEAATEDGLDEEEERDSVGAGERLLLGIEDLVISVLTLPLLWVAFVVTYRRKGRGR